MPSEGEQAFEQAFDHPIFRESLRLIRELPGVAAALAPLTPLQQDVLLRLIHSSGDPSLAAQLRWSPGACEAGLAALAAGAPILTDTAMAAAAVAPMARRTFGNPVRSVLDWAPDQAPAGSTRTAAGMAAALAELQQPAVVLIGSAPTALEVLLAQGAKPALVIGMPVGFVGVAESKRHLAASGLAHIRLEGSKGGAGLVAAACNALLRAAWLQAASAPSAPPASS
ncbi:precorrin-8X methylmutase [Cyanobium sp. Aljojuca 7D2]|uniref:precorrin-8X methylmutase n=1 Tax=Cyanobium sp. Aljojuca 7D2 TaxID=2823698 RepID=UPI0020CC8C4F|nr:precorrin-8X methylmutase [Cyanobium sp. Aljojuca 7D2]MCP9890219.1 precorrin-8X methylmutase [Cyanobium sp. Aljojuca 7D2]